MILTGITDEAGALIDTQIKAVKELGWNTIEARSVEVEGFPKANLHDIADEAFDVVEEKLKNGGVGVYCFGSTIANWGKKIDDPFDLSEVERAIPRMQRLGSQYVRIMSYAVREGEDQLEEERFHRLREITKRFLDAGITPVHENCMNYGGMSWQHALKLLENVPGLKWVFDTANPVFNDDRSKPEPMPKQDPWEFWTHLKEHTVHIHVKDAIWDNSKNDADYTLPGKGDGAVRRILSDALESGYDAGISIEPHLAVVFHDDSVKASDEEIYQSFIGYGKALMELLDDIQKAR
ncbi:MAG: sugar phosphate isomerase/epimerase family protein [Limisphaerales bacterium]|jgi:sugar phosphate isomerase/epimerase|nr:TIM barrel protein [Verrucomicrobiota bacterium]HBF02092.1 xylose isomerase [Verrucomicrobiales bacterium]HCQ84702.1 xylose isomerase [Verrucomicrobiales bacterium]|tara:strand:+ start:516 stop:1394 length:879 start_codon:yes stop_codon:yes gene_type:complete